MILLCSRKGVNIPKRVDLTGESYGDFTVVEMLYGYKQNNNKPRTYCRCLGVDKKEYIIRADALRSGATKSVNGVGCKVEAKDVTNQRFGNLIALNPTQKKASNGCIIWHCRCDCGNYIDVPVGNLIRGHTRSCGHRHQSKYVEIIANYLSDNNIQYIQEYRFNDCTNSDGYMLPFDFYLPKYNVLIEYDGPHHVEPIKGWGGLEKFKRILCNDSIKNNYCREHSIPLLRIPHNKNTDVEIIDMVKSFLSPLEITVA